jgi:urease accessory protein
MRRYETPGAGRAALLLLADGRFPAGGHAHSGGAEQAVHDGRLRTATDLTTFCHTRLHTAGLVAAALAATATAMCAGGDAPGERPGGYGVSGTAGPEAVRASVPAELPGGRGVLCTAGPVGGCGPVAGAVGAGGVRTTESGVSDTSRPAAGRGLVPGEDVPTFPPGFDLGGLDVAADARTPSATLRSVSRRLGRQLVRAARAVWPHPALEELAAAFPRGAHQPVVLGVTAYAAGLGPLDAAYATAYEAVSGPATATVRLLGLDPFEATAATARLAPDIDAIAAAAVRAAGRARAEGLDALPAASWPLLDIAAEDHAARPVRLFAS